MFPVEYALSALVLIMLTPVVYAVVHSVFQHFE